MTTHSDLEGQAGGNGPRRPLGWTLRRRALPLLAVFCVLGSVLLMAAPSMKRTYDLSATMGVNMGTFAPLPELARLPEMAVKETEPLQKSRGVQMTISEVKGEQDPRKWIVTLSAASPTRESALAKLQLLANQYETVLQNRVTETTSAYRSGLEVSLNRLMETERTQARAVEEYRLKHPGALPDDPTSTLGKFEKLMVRLDEKQQRLQIVTQQITRLQEYKKAGAGGSGDAPPPPLPSTEGSETVAAPVKPERDPEVMALTAQLQLISNQIDEQLTTMGRREQHPYVVDLRSQQASMAKKLEAAKQRASAGKPPPLDTRPTHGGSKPSDANMMAVDMELERMQGERDALAAEVKNLMTQREGMQKQVNEVLPVRQEYEKLTGDLAATKKERDQAREQTRQFDQHFKGSAEKELAIAEVKALAIADSSTLPSFPRLSMVYGIGLLIAAAAALALALLLHRMDRSLHSVQEAAVALEVPILGAVSEIRTPSQQKRVRTWRTFGRPAIGLALLLCLVISAVICYTRLADPKYTKTLSQRDATSLFFALDVGE
jgi:hypothetical protein